MASKEARQRAIKRAAKLCDPRTASVWLIRAGEEGKRLRKRRSAALDREGEESPRKRIHDRELGPSIFGDRERCYCGWSTKTCPVHALDREGEE
jgi:hypothetical protein